ncbi:hypothetical protein FB45DRAFT_1054720 [Roridomyces roridus]|uniref:Uncharacterized protein n=1 Tax=Roridomyces roridus TaxID=1738132 RepID=A0AAD7FQY2_9AGAR|nr:hypothetical protein FB45DRAFT_1054720 [Roridomyces roridus]
MLLFPWLLLLLALEAYIKSNYPEYSLLGPNGLPYAAREIVLYLQHAGIRLGLPAAPSPPTPVSTILPPNELFAQIYFEWLPRFFMLVPLKYLIPNGVPIPQSIIWSATAFLPLPFALCGVLGEHEDVNIFPLDIQFSFLRQAISLDFKSNDWDVLDLRLVVCAMACLLLIDALLFVENHVTPWILRFEERVKALDAKTCEACIVDQVESICESTKDRLIKYGQRGWARMRGTAE